MAATGDLRPTVALTGGSGFIGRRIAHELLQRGVRVRALLRRPAYELEQAGVEPCPGSLEDEASLGRLVAGAAAIVHAAGAIRAPSAEAYVNVNRLGTARLLDATQAAGSGTRFVLLSSLAARHQSVSPYARSKHLAEAEIEARADKLRAIVVRPPAVYGPGDRATLPVFAQLARGHLVGPRAPGNRFSLLYVDDLARLIADLAVGEVAPVGGPIEPDDANPGGYAWADLARIASEVTRRPVRLISVPRRLMIGAAIVAEGISGLLRTTPPLSRGKVAELFHPDWVAGRHTVHGLSWRPQVRFEDGFAATLSWYKQSGWLSSTPAGTSGSLNRKGQ